MTKMKDSGIDWIGEIPEEWKVGSLKHYFDVQLGKMLQPNKIGGMDVEIDYLKAINVQWDNVQVDHLSKMWCSTDEIGKYEILDGDLVICEGGEVGRCGIIKGLQSRTIIQNALHRVRSTNKADVKFLNYYIQHTTMSKWFEILCNKATIAHLTSEKLLNTLVVLPSLSEQIKIADYLDQKVAQLDKVKALLEEQIATLQDYRQSLIYETVTKGLDKTATLKDSSVDWIGQIPEGWEIGRLKHFYNLFAGGDIREDNFSIEYSEQFCYPVLSNSKENNGIFGYSDIFRFEQGTVTVTGRGDIGYAEYRDYRYFPIIRLLVCVPYVSVDGRYTTYWINSSVIEKNQTAIPQLTRFTLGELPLPKISLGEQIEIADYLDKKVNQINQMIDIKQKQIENINQQRQTLIYDVVTGKRRV